MEFDLVKLKNHIEDMVEIHETKSFPQELLVTTEILELNNVEINGYITLDTLEEYELNLVIHGTMVLPCAVTLKPVDYPFSIEIHDNLNNLIKEIDENHKNIENSIDILPIIWENILMEIPMRVVSKDAENLELKGDGWKLITEDHEEEQEVNPELEKLKDLL